MRYKVGNRIKINSFGGLYSTYYEMADVLKLKNYEYAYHPNCLLFSYEGKITSIHQNYDVFLGVRLDNGKDIILSGNKQHYRYIDIIKPFELPKELFEI